jgi:phospholipid/cholesterol/gamma-HCH transport system substrate-binding protein
MSTRTLRGHVATIGIALVVAVSWFGYWLYHAGAFPSLEGYTYHVNAIVPDAGTLGTGASVRIAGVQVGRVTSIQVDGAGAVIGLEINKDNAPLAADTRVAVRLRTLVGENYIQLYQGHAHTTLRDGATLPMTQADDYVQPDQILNALRGPTRQRARELIRGLGTAVDGRGPQLNQLLGGLSGTIQAASPVVSVLNHDRAQVARLIDSLGSLSAAVGQRGTALQNLARSANVSFQAIANRDQAVEQTLRQLPATLDQVRSTTTILRSVTGQIAPVLSNLASAIVALRPAASLLRPAADEGQVVVNELGQTAPALQTTMARLQALSPPALRALPQLRSMLCQVNPAVSYLSPYAADLAALIQGLGSATNFYDATGHGARLMPSVGVDNLKIYNAPTAAAINQLLNTGLIGKAYSTGYNPYPAPGAAGDTSVGLGWYGPAAVKQQYPHIVAAC